MFFPWRFPEWVLQKLWISENKLNDVLFVWNLNPWDLIDKLTSSDCLHCHIILERPICCIRGKCTLHRYLCFMFSFLICLSIAWTIEVFWPLSGRNRKVKKLCLFHIWFYEVSSELRLFIYSCYTIHLL